MKNNLPIQVKGLNYIQFYKELGPLLYVIAYSDGKIRRREVDALREFILEELSPIEGQYDSSGMNLAFYAQFEFDDIVKRNISPEEASSSFVKYLRNNAAFIDEQLKRSIIEAVVKVAESYKKINKKEEVVINKLRNEIINL